MVESSNSWLIWDPPLILLPVCEAVASTQSCYLGLLLDIKPHYFQVVVNKGPVSRYPLSQTKRRDIEAICTRRLAPPHLGPDVSHRPEALGHSVDCHHTHKS